MSTCPMQQMYGAAIDFGIFLAPNPELIYLRDSLLLVKQRSLQVNMSEDQESSDLRVTTDNKDFDIEIQPLYDKGDQDTLAGTGKKQVLKILMPKG